MLGSSFTEKSYTYITKTESRIPTAFKVIDTSTLTVPSGGEFTEEH